MKKIFFLAIAAGLLLIPAIAYAAPTTDTITGTTITTGTYNMLVYTDLGGTKFLPISPEAITTLVTSEFGIDDWPNFAGKNMTPTELATFEYIITNEGNAADVYTITAEVYFGGSAVNWNVSIDGGPTTAYEDGDMLHLKTATTKRSSAETVEEDARYYLRVTVSPSTEAPDGAFANLTIEVTTKSTPVGVYTGANAVQYGGLAATSDATLTKIVSAKMKMTRIATVDAPVLYKGATHDAVPGSIITYTIIVSNEGTGSSESVWIVDRVPTSTEAIHIGYGSGSQGTIANVGITATAPNASGWVCYFTTEATTATEPVKAFAAGSWTTIPFGSVLTKDATWVKFTKAEITPETYPITLTWGVVIQ